MTIHPSTLKKLCRENRLSDVGTTAELKERLDIIGKLPQDIDDQRTEAQSPESIPNHSQNGIIIPGASSGVVATSKTFQDMAREQIERLCMEKNVEYTFTKDGVELNAPGWGKIFQNWQAHRDPEKAAKNVIVWVQKHINERPFMNAGAVGGIGF